MTLDEFEEVALTVLELAGADVNADGRVVLLGILLKEYAIRMPSDLAAYREHVRQQEDITAAVKMAAATGKLHTMVAGEPS